MNASIFAQRLVLINLALGRAPTHGLKTITEHRGYKLTLATLIRKGLATQDATVQGTVRIAPAGLRKVRGAVHRLQHRVAVEAATIQPPLEEQP